MLKPCFLDLASALSLRRSEEYYGKMKWEICCSCIVGDSMDVALQKGPTINHMPSRILISVDSTKFTAHFFDNGYVCRNGQYLSLLRA
jgi:hypothetical protein